MKETGLFEVIKNVFIDLDRTLWDFEANAEETLKEIFDKYNLNKNFESFEIFYSGYRKHNEKLWEDYRNGKIDKKTLSWKRFYLILLDGNLNNPDMAQKLAGEYINISPTKKKLFPGTISVLEYLSEKYSLNLITNGFKEVQHKKVINCGIEKYFDNIFTSDELGVQKPNTVFFDKMLELSNSAKDESLVIGDDLQVDIKGAANSGIKSVWFNNKGKYDKFKAYKKADYEITSLNELKKVL